MPRIHRPAAFVAIFLAVALVIPTTAGAATSRSRRAALARKLDALRASDRELVTAVNALNAQVNTQINRVTAAKKAATAADAGLAEATAKLQATEDQITQLRTSVVSHAVDAYMRPQGHQPTINSRDIAEASRQRAMWNQIASRQGDVLDQLHAARQDLAIHEAVASRARERAAQRKRETTAQLDGLASDLRDKQRLSVALEARIRDAEAEDNATAANDASIGALLRGAGDPGVVSKSGLIWPIRGQVTSGFGRRWGRLHAGIDIAAPRGTPIRAARAGRVVFSGWMGGYGNAIIINHGGGMATLYGHQSRRAAKVGDVVKQGQIIGYVGSTGHSTGNHLHFETRINGTPQNPRRYLS
jgi:murein DD-endopeptidase MepM/ murein hydrolase activator NlpD